MNTHLRFLPGLLACGALAMAFSAQAGAGSARVDAIKGGAAQCSTDGVTWNEVKKGAVLSPGATVKTDSMGLVDLYLAKNGPYVRLTPDTTLTLSTLNIESGVGETIVTTEMDLKAGTIQGVVNKMSAASKYTVATPVGVVHITGTKYQVSARGEFSVKEGQGSMVYNAPGATAPTDFQVRAGYTFEPTLNNNKGGLIETLPSVTEEITVAANELGGAMPAGEVAVPYRPTPTWATIDRPFAPPGQKNSFTPFDLPPVFNPTTVYQPPQGGGE